MDILAMLRRIDALLKEKNMKKEDFYAAVPITDAAVSQWRKGKTQPTKKKLERMAEILDVDIQYLEYGHKKSAPAVSGKSDSRRLLDSYLDEFTEAEIAELLAEIKEKRNNQE